MIDVESRGRPERFTADEDGGYQVHVLKKHRYATPIAFVTCYDDGRRTVEFDGDRVYPVELVEEIVRVAMSLSSR